MLENKRILILANDSVGLCIFRGDLIKRLVQNNTVIASTPITGMKEELEAYNCKLIDTAIDRRGLNPLKDIRLFSFYLSLVRQVKPDLVVSYTIKPNVYGGLVCRLKHIPYAINITGLGTAFENSGLLRKTAVFLNRMACKGAKVVFFENEENRQIFINEKIVKEKQTYRLNGAGVNLDKFQIAEYPKGEKIVFLFMGRVMAEKGINELFEAMSHLIEEGYSCELDVLGSYEEDYKEKIEKYEAEGWLHYYGYQKDVRPFIEKCHCFVLPSWHEGMANTNLESAAMGRPVITSNIHGCKESVIDGKTGYLCESKNMLALYETLKRFMQLSYDERKTMGLEGRTHMENVFDKKKVIHETITHL